MAKPRIAFYTPLQPVESGISLYSEQLLPLLAEILDIDVVVDGYRPSVLEESGSISIHDHRSYDHTRPDLYLYQVGNSPAHIYMLPEVRNRPGIMVLHDTVLNHLFVQEAARNGTLPSYRDEMESMYGAEGLRAARRVLQGQSPDDLFRFPMSESLVESSLATIVHSEFARTQVRDWGVCDHVVRVPLGMKPPQYLDPEIARQALGLPGDQFVIASITHINPHKRIDVVLRAFKALRSSVPARLILAGSVSPNFPLDRIINHLGLDQVVDTPGYVSDLEARLITAAADVIVNLRYPTAGETSGSLLHSMAAGRPVLVSNTGSFNEVPSDAVISIPVDAIERDMLQATFMLLAENEDLRLKMGRHAREFVRREHSLQRWVNGYIELISRLTGLQIERPQIDEYAEPLLDDELPIRNSARSSLHVSLGQDLAELGVGGDETLLSEVANASVELGLGVGMMADEMSSERATGGGRDDQ
jgi:glycosyltransferase involved in cell wall biosynthesis